jgi:hypothetical protein
MGRYPTISDETEKLANEVYRVLTSRDKAELNKDIALDFLLYLTKAGWSPPEPPVTVSAPSVWIGDTNKWWNTEIVTETA